MTVGTYCFLDYMENNGFLVVLSEIILSSSFGRTDVLEMGTMERQTYVRL